MKISENNVVDRINLEDVTFIIPLRLDSPERKENVDILCRFLLKYFITNILVMEADKEEMYKPPKGVRKQFIRDVDEVFHHTRYRNDMVNTVTTNIIGIWDTDALCNPGQIVSSAEILRSNIADMVYPYDGRYYATLSLFKKVYNEVGHIRAFEENISKFRLYHGFNFVGGAFIANRKSYCNAGMENENFYGWGPEDEERYKRWQILGYRVLRVEGPLFHLDHPRGKTSWFFDKENEIRSRQEFLKICSMNPSELRVYIDSWQ